MAPTLDITTEVTTCKHCGEPARYEGTQYGQRAYVCTATPDHLTIVNGTLIYAVTAKERPQ